MTIPATIALQSAAKTIWDAIVIGAGPAGSSTALMLARQHRRVLLVDRSAFPRAKVCGGCLNENTRSAIATLGLTAMMDELGLQPVRTMMLSNPRHGVRLPIQNWSLSRFTLDAALIRAAIQESVAFLPSVRAALGELQHDGRCVRLSTDDASVVAKGRVIVLANGLSAGTVSEAARIGAGVVLADSPVDYPANTLGMAVGNGGYVGWVQVEHGQLELAAAFDPSFVKSCRSLGVAAQRVLRDAKFPPIRELEAAPWKGTPFLNRRVQHLAGPRWFAVGDAAGYVEPFTGEGMAWAMHGAIALAPLASQGIDRWQPELCVHWRQAHARVVGQRTWICRALSSTLRSPLLTSGLLRILANCPQLANPFLQRLGRPSHHVRMTS